MAILVFCLPAIIHRSAMLAALVSNEYLLNILLKSSLLCCSSSSHICPSQSCQIQYLVGCKIPGEAVPQECGDALLPSSEYQPAVHVFALPVGFIHQSECLPERELLSSCPRAADRETEAQQRRSKCCAQCPALIVPGWRIIASALSSGS